MGVFEVLGRRQQHQLIRSSRSRTELVERVRAGRPGELPAIAATELGEPFGIVPVPLAQVVARRHVLCPRVERCPLPGEASWPKAVDEDTAGWILPDLVVDAGHPYAPRTPDRGAARGRSGSAGWRCGSGIGPPLGKLRGEAFELFEVERREALESGSSRCRQVKADDPTVVPVTRPLDQPCAVGPIDEPDDTVMAEEQIVGHLADGRTPTIGMPADGEQELVLRGGEPGCPCLVFAPAFEASQTRPDGEQTPVVIVRKPRSCHDVKFYL